MDHKVNLPFPSGFTHKVLLEHSYSHAHLFAPCL
jgi:hypothetical protein